MKKIVSICTLFILLSNLVEAQKYGYNKGDNMLNAGVGVNSYYGAGLPLNISFETGITQEISVGASFDYLSWNYKPVSNSSYKFNALYFGARASYHVNGLLNIDNEKIDLYGGATIGYRSFSWKDNYSNNTLSGKYGNGLFFGGYIGGKYYFTSQIGAFTELGAVGSTNARFGAAFKF